jgi:hypothetical protein
VKVLRKTVLAIVIVFLCSIACFYTPSALGRYVECVVNGGFEQDFDGWFNQGAEIDNETAHSGSKSATVAYSQSFSQYFDPAVPSGFVVAFTFWVKRAEGSGNSLGITVEFNEEDGQGRKDAYTFVSQTDVPADDQWHFINLTDWLSEVSEFRGITRIVFGCGSYNWLQWWVDDVSLLLYEEEEEPPSTIPSDVTFNIQSVDVGVVAPGSSKPVSLPFTASSPFVLTNFRLEGNAASYVEPSFLTPKQFSRSGSFQLFLKVPSDAQSGTYTVKVYATANVGGYMVSSSAILTFKVESGAGSIVDFFGHFMESVKLAWERLTGNPGILLLLLLMVLALGYYALRRR